MSPEERFWSKVDGSNVSQCWIWTARRNGNGYGTFALRNGCPVLAHRFAYECLRADIPSGLQIDHLCRNRLCVNPWHLEPVTARVNVLRNSGPAAINARRTRCVNGHAFDEANTYFRRSGARVCRACRRDRMRRYSREAAPTS